MEPKALVNTIINSDGDGSELEVKLSTTLRTTLDKLSGWSEYCEDEVMDDDSLKRFFNIEDTEFFINSIPYSLNFYPNLNITIKEMIEEPKTYLKRIGEFEEESQMIQISLDEPVIEGLLRLMSCDREYYKNEHDNEGYDFVGCEFNCEDQLIIIQDNGKTKYNLMTFLNKEDVYFDYERTYRDILSGEELKKYDTIILKWLRKEGFGSTFLFKEGRRFLDALLFLESLDEEEFSTYYDGSINKLINRKFKDTTFYLIGIDGELELELTKFKREDFYKTLDQLYKY